MKKTALFIIFISIILSQTRAQTFPCNGSLYLTQSDGGASTILNKIYLDNNDAQFEKVAEYATEINANGFNPNDQYIYGFERNTKAIVQLRRDGSFNVIGNTVGFSPSYSASGVVTAEGVYIIQDHISDKLHFYQLNPSFSKLDEVALTWSPSSGNSGICDVNFDDFVVDPNNDERLITYQRNYTHGNAPKSTEGSLLAIDINSNSGTYGQVSIIEIIPKELIIQIGAMFFGNDGLLYGYGSKVEPPEQKHLITINPYTGVSNYIAQGPESRSTDGCSCPVNLKFTKSIEEIEELCNSIFVTYRFTLVNKSLGAFAGLNFIDQLPNEGKFMNSFDNEIWGTSNISLSPNSDSLVISDISIAANDSISFTAEVRYPIQAGDFANQAKINGLSSFLGNEILSDDPSTPEPLDPTIFTIEDPQQGIRNNIDTTICYNEVLQVNDSVYTQSGTYQQILEGAAAEGCDSIIEIDLNIASLPMTSIQKEVCFGEEFNFHGDLIDEPGTYTDTLTSARGCDSMVTLELSVADELNVSATNNYTVDNCTVIEAEINPEFDVDRVVWEPADGLSCDDCLSPQINVENDMTYTVRIYNNAGCFAEVPIQVTATGSASKDDILVPNAFSPHNNDEINDYFTLFSSQCIIQIKEFLIYNRWGNLVFEQRDIPPSVPELGWDGSFNSKEAPPAVYVYYFKVVFYDGSTTTLSGDVTLVN